jgi:cell division protein FtsL
MEAFEYAIRKDIRNNPIVREVDQARVRDMWRSVLVGTLLVVIVLGSAWEHFEVIRYGYRIERMQQQITAEQEQRQQLRLQIQTLRSPQRIERLATAELNLKHPSAEDTVILERVVPTEHPAASVVALR